ncbi:MAG: hypothetical protein HOA60_13045, partial [Rhodospirillales bacterium]|nr:hypothetical protein [Rhodospirillales bacterium]
MHINPRTIQIFVMMTGLLIGLVSQAVAQEQELELEPESLKPGDVFSDCDNCPEMVVVPAG